jgi:hypothetical protein
MPGIGYANQETQMAVVNRALALLDAKSVSEEEYRSERLLSLEGKNVKLFYDPVLRECLAENNWAFARARQKLELLTRHDAAAAADVPYPPAEDGYGKYQYKYHFPGGVVEVRALLDANFERMDLGWRDAQAYRRQLGTVQEKRWQCNSGYVYTNEPDVWMEFTSFTEGSDQNNWPAFFDTAFVYRLAAACARKTTGSQTIATDMWNHYMMAMASAKNLEAKMEGPRMAY